MAAGREGKRRIWEEPGAWGSSEVRSEPGCSQWHQYPELAWEAAGWRGLSVFSQDVPPSPVESLMGRGLS